MDVKLPKLGEGADSGTVVNIFVKEGDQVAKDQAILELENEKAVATIPSTAAGVVAKIHVKNGDKISVGQRLDFTLTKAAAVAAAPAAAAPKPAAKEVVAHAAPEPRKPPRESRRSGEANFATEHRRPRRRPFAGWRANWALICAGFAAANGRPHRHRRRARLHPAA